MWQSSGLARSYLDDFALKNRRCQLSPSQLQFARQLNMHLSRSPVHKVLFLFIQNISISLLSSFGTFVTKFNLSKENKTVTLHGQKNCINSKCYIYLSLLCFLYISIYLKVTFFTTGFLDYSESVD